ncbi:thio(seleno)oxazole modification radical SAM maturase SbtM [Desulfogranum japonicum]|uniref:thio(seleno)oxazole modification radical SAM maturase SbtM n=1 Tax=Desulfogranum japonicum TaxID=231447 RepID=UPI00048F1905|nr:thio(seleno)oxazole modification radical SAM maturase SbtM [Desulfogranum japonicum]
MPHIAEIYPVCYRLLGNTIPQGNTNDLARYLARHPHLCTAHPYLPDLAQLEAALHEARQKQPRLPDSVTERTVNPSVELLPLNWQFLPDCLGNQQCKPVPEKDRVLIWYHPTEKKWICRSATGHDLLAMKMAWEHLDSREVAVESQLTLGAVDNILFAAQANGLLLAPGSRLTRPTSFSREKFSDNRLFTAQTFTLQWHITQICDLHCRHCYDRSERVPLSLEQGIHILDELYAFCNAHHVYAQVSFTGGNPFLYPHFDILYQEAADRGFLTAILGNPVPQNRLEKILAIQKPEFFQISLEGLEPHNDYIRGQGHFQRSLQFLELLADLDIFSMVMLTLTRANQGQVLALAQFLQDRTNLFTFNRLAQVGEGAALESVPISTYEAFLHSYIEAAAKSPRIRLKDNLFNLACPPVNQPITAGCAGHGCGAAFNFLALLPDGEIHACRKLPSKLGNIYESSLSSIYHSPLAEQYRNGPAECRGCTLYPICRGCLAVAYGFDLDIFQQRDPYCFINERRNTVE